MCPAFFLGEHPNPIPDASLPAGFPVTVSFVKGQKVTSASLTLTNSHDTIMKGFYSDPEHPFNAGSGENTVCLVPTYPLVRDERYTAGLSALVDGKQVKETWSFTTGSRVF